MSNKLWKYFLENKTICVLNLVVVIILFVPYSYSLGQTYEAEELHWISNFIFNELDLIIFYSPVLILTITFQITSKKIYRKILLILNMIISLCQLVIALFSLVFPIQDFLPGIGMFLIVSLFPLITVIYIIESLERAGKNNESSYIKL